MSIFGFGEGQDPYTGHAPGRIVQGAPDYSALSAFNKGGAGFGQGAYDRAKESGLNNRTIRSMLAGSGLQIGGAVADILNVNPIQTVNWATDSTGPNQRPILAAAGAEGPGWGSTSGLVTDSQYAKQMGGNTAGIAHGGWGAYFDPTWDREWAYDNVGGYNRPPDQNHMWQQMMMKMMEDMMNPESDPGPTKDPAPTTSAPQFSYSTSSTGGGTSSTSNKISATTQAAKKKALAMPNLQTLNI